MRDRPSESSGGFPLTTCSRRVSMVESSPIPNRERKTPATKADRAWAHVAGLVRATWARPAEGPRRDALYGPKGGRRQAEFRKSRQGETGVPAAPAPEDGVHQLAAAQPKP